MRVEAADLVEKAEALERLAKDLEQRPPNRAGEQPLTYGSKSASLDSDMTADVADQPRHVKIAASRTQNRSRAKRHLLETGLTDKDIAKALGVARSTVSAWFTGRNQMPAEQEARLRALFGIPASVPIRPTRKS